MSLELFRPDRCLATLCVNMRDWPHDECSFSFLGPYFITEVFLYLPDVHMDVSVLDDAFMEDIGFIELPEEKQQQAWRDEATDLDIERFSVFLRQLEECLGELSESSSETRTFRTSPTAHAVRIREALDFIAANRGKTFTLVITYVDEHL